MVLTCLQLCVASTLLMPSNSRHAADAPCCCSSRCVGGAPERCSPDDAARRIALLALDMLQFTASFETRTKRRLQIRIGINSGDAMAAVMVSCERLVPALSLSHSL